MSLKSINESFERQFNAINDSKNEEFKVLESLRNLLSVLNEAGMSDEDRKESDLIRSAYAKIQKRSNARLTPQEQDVLNKYGIKRGATKNLEYDSGRNYTRDDTNIIDNQDDRYSHGKEIGRRVYPKKPDGSTDWDKAYTLKTKDQDKINYADRARKRPEREKNRTYDYTTDRATFGTRMKHAFDDRGIIDYNLKPGTTDKRGRNYGVDQNTAINRMSHSRLAKMAGALGDREDAQADLNNAKAKFDARKADADAAYMKKMQDAERSYDWSMDYANKEYKRDSDPSRRDKAQAEIDALLKRKKTEALDTKSTRELINRVRSCRDLDSALEMVYYSILVGNGMPADIIKSGAKRINLSKIPGTMTKSLEDDTSWKKASTPDEVANRIEQILAKVERPSKKKKESLKEAWSVNDLYSDIYNALSDVMFKWHEAGYDLDSSQIDSAYEWFATHFWEDEGFEED